MVLFGTRRKGGEAQMTFLAYVEAQTDEYLKSIPKKDRKKIGQFFTPSPIANFMGKLSGFYGNTVHILDPGAGCGILTAGIIDSLLERSVKHIVVDLYENNNAVIPLLESNMQYIKRSLEEKHIVLDFSVIPQNFIVHNQFVWTGMLQSKKYDIVLSNPPYKKIGKHDIESQIMRDIVYGQPNLYFLFMAMGAKLLKENGELIYIVPRSFSSGLYFTSFRKWFLSQMRVTNLHLFTSREAVSRKSDNVLQETVILRAIKTNRKQSSITISESNDEFCEKQVCRYKANYNTCVSNDENAFLYFPTSKEDVAVLNFINDCPHNLPMLGFRMKTGLLVDFREKKWMRENSDSTTVPLLWPYNFDDVRVRFPVQVDGKPQYIKDDDATKHLQMRKGNYLLLKRFTSKEERRRLQCALVFDDDFPEFNSISTENHLNFIVKQTGKMHREELYGLYVWLNSSYLDCYFRILNGSTQVNATEINSMPFPALSDICSMGEKAMEHTKLDSTTCDMILESQLLPQSINTITV
jgi:adenine-specific DNA-methyltransferase